MPLTCLCNGTSVHYIQPTTAKLSIKIKKKVFQLKLTVNDSSQLLCSVCEQRI